MIRVAWRGVALRCFDCIASVVLPSPARCARLALTLTITTTFDININTTVVVGPNRLSPCILSGVAVRRLFNNIRFGSITEQTNRDVVARPPRQTAATLASSGVNVAE